MYERDLQDLIRGLRSDAAKRNEPKFIAEVVNEIRKEISSEDMDIKAGAVCKLTYLDMLGYDMSWASFNMVEVMSSTYFHIKSVGYLAAATSFDQDTDVLMLTTNLLKKDLSSANAANAADISASLNALADIVTPSLARDLSQDLIPMLTHSRPLIRKRAVLVLYKMSLRYPPALDLGFARLQEKLQDPDTGVVSATVNVLCELARKDPERFLPLAPQLFQLLTTSSNNWMLIKIIKLFGAMTPCEPRLIKKLQPPLTDLISTTPAVSLLYECVHTCIIGGMFQGSQGKALAKLCVDKLAAFLDDPDQNLKYIALLALVKIVPSHPHLVAEHQELILASVNDTDVSIRMRALDLISVMVTRHSLQPIVQHLLSHLSDTASSLPTASQSLQRLAGGASTPASVATLSPAYRLDVANRILTMCSRDTYDNIDDFEWYISVLVDLTYVAKANVGEDIKAQLLDVCIRVRNVRRYAVALVRRLLEDSSFLDAVRDGEDGSCAEVLWAAAWISGEYASELTNPYPLICQLLSPLISDLPVDIRAIYIQSAIKILGTWTAELAEHWDDRPDDLQYEQHQLTAVKRDIDSIIEACQKWVADPDLEVQERAAVLSNLLKFIKADLATHKPSVSQTRPRDSPSEGFTADEEKAAFQPTFPKSLLLLHPLSSAYELNPVAKMAQVNVKLPDGMDLDMWIVDEHVAYGGDGVEDGEGRKSKGKKKTATDGGGGEEGAVEQGKKKKKKKRNQDGVDDVMDVVSQSVHGDEHRENYRQERLERLRDDPYYITDRRSTPLRGSPQSTAATSAYEVDSIPIVKLDGLSLHPSSSPNPHSGNVLNLHPYSSISRSHTPRFEVDKGGEMPPESTHATSHGPPESSSMEGGAGGVEDVVVSPQPIQVVRAKKKGKKKASVAI